MVRGDSRPRLVRSLETRGGTGLWEGGGSAFVCHWAGGVRVAAAGGDSGRTDARGRRRSAAVSCVAARYFDDHLAEVLIGRHGGVQLLNPGPGLDPVHGRAELGRRAVKVEVGA